MYYRLKYTWCNALNIDVPTQMTYRLSNKCLPTSNTLASRRVIPVHPIGSNRLDKIQLSLRALEAKAASMRELEELFELSPTR